LLPPRFIASPPAAFATFPGATSPNSAAYRCRMNRRIVCAAGSSAASAIACSFRALLLAHAYVDQDVSFCRCHAGTSATRCVIEANDEATTRVVTTRVKTEVESVNTWKNA